MIIYGVALLSGCLVIGNLIGEALGALLGIKANVGGVGIAMLFLVLVTNSRLYQNQHADAASSGIQFWSAMYIWRWLPGLLRWSSVSCWCPC